MIAMTTAAGSANTLAAFIYALLASRGRVGERACHLLLNALHRTSADAAQTVNETYAWKSPLYLESIGDS